MNAHPACNCPPKRRAARGMRACRPRKHFRTSSHLFDFRRYFRLPWMRRRGSGAASMPIATLATAKLRQLQEMMDRTLGLAGLDAYSRAHLEDARRRVEKALDAQYIYNADQLGGGSIPIILFGEPQGERTP